MVASDIAERQPDAAAAATAIAKNPRRLVSITPTPLSILCRTSPTIDGIPFDAWSFPSAKTVVVSSKATPCLRLFSAAFTLSRAKRIESIISMYFLWRYAARIFFFFGSGGTPQNRSRCGSGEKDIRVLPHSETHITPSHIQPSLTPTTLIFPWGGDTSPRYPAASHGNALTLAPHAIPVSKLPLTALRPRIRPDYRTACVPFRGSPSLLPAVLYFAMLIEQEKHDPRGSSSSVPSRARH